MLTLASVHIAIRMGRRHFAIMIDHGVAAAPQIQLPLMVQPSSRGRGMTACVTTQELIESVKFMGRCRLTEMGGVFWITQRNHSSLQIQAARLAHIPL